MKNLIIKNQITANTVAEVRNQVENILCSYGYLVFKSVSGAEECLNDNFEDSKNKELQEETVQVFTVPGEPNGDWETTIRVTIKAYYKDAGSVDYCYVVNVEEY